MKKIIITALVALFALNAAACGSDSVTKAKAAQQEDMAQFSSDLTKYMTEVSAKEVDVSPDLIKITADCKPNQGAYHTRCWVTIKSPMSAKPEKATAENVRRVGDKFVWDHES